MKVTTEHSVYQIRDGFLCRQPDHGDAADLRMDRDRIPLLSIETLAVGEPAVFLIDVRGDGVHTIRRTTPVVSIEDDA